MVLITKTDARPDEEIKKALDAVIEDAKDKWNMDYEGWYPKQGFGITELAPFHISAGGSGWISSDYWGASIAASNTWQDWMNISQTDMAYAIMTGLFDLEPTPIITHVRPNLGGQGLPAMNIEHMHALDIARAWFEKPLTVAPESNFTMRILANDAGTERIGILGYCVGKTAILILEK